MHTKEEEPEEELEPKVEASCLTRQGAANLQESRPAHPKSVGDSNVLASPLYQSALLHTAATWIGTKDESTPFQQEFIGLRFWQIKKGKVHGLIKSRKMTTEGMEAEDAEFEGNLVPKASEDGTLDDALILEGFTIEPKSGDRISLKVEMRLPRPQEHKLRRSSSSDANGKPKLLLSPPPAVARRFTINTGPARSYADALRGRSSQAASSNPTIQEPNGKAGACNSPAIIQEESEEDNSILEEHFPAPCSPKHLSPPSPRLSRKPLPASRYLGAFERAVLVGSFGREAITLAYHGEMSYEEWCEGSFMKSGKRQTSVYKESSLAFQLL